MALQNPITKMPFQKTMPQRETKEVEKPIPFRREASYSDYQPRNKVVTAISKPYGSLSSPASGNAMQPTGRSVKVSPNTIAKDLTNRKKKMNEDLNERSGNSGPSNNSVNAVNLFPMRPKSLRKPESLNK